MARRSQFSREDITAMRRLYKAGWKQDYIARRYGISQQYVSLIVQYVSLIVSRKRRKRK